jgi:hypothetical protein
MKSCETKGTQMKKGSNGGQSMTGAAAARIQSAAARGNGGKVSSGSFAARAQSAAAKGGGKK